MRISVTELDAYRRYRDQEDVELEQLLLQLRKLEPPSQAMLAGKAFHYVLEHAKPGEELTTAKVDDFTFRFQLDCALELPRVRELKGEIVVMTSVGPVTLVGVVDGLDGPVIDYKLTSRFEAERYADSYQWRCYLLMFGMSKTAAESRHMERVAAIGCVVCRRLYGRFVPCQLHHVAEGSGLRSNFGVVGLVR
jgi:hypothetical protein